MHIKYCIVPTYTVNFSRDPVKKKVDNQGSQAAHLTKVGGRICTPVIQLYSECPMSGHMVNILVLFHKDLLLTLSSTTGPSTASILLRAAC